MKKIVLLLLLALPVLLNAKVDRLITVDTPYVNDSFLVLDLVGYKPLNVQGNISLFDEFLNLSAETTLPYWLLKSPNFGAKASLKIPGMALTAGISYHILQFNGSEMLINWINQQDGMPVTVNEATLNFTSSKLQIVTGYEISLITLYAVGDFMFIGNEMGSSTYFHPVIGADIDFLLFKLFAELGYYIATDGDTETAESGFLSTQLPSDFTAGIGAQVDIGAIQLRAGVQYPGMVIQYSAGDPLELSVIPYFNFALQF